MNELIFIGHTLFISLCVLSASRFGKECLLTLSAILWLLANLFVTKQIDIFGFTVTSSDAFVVGGSLITALITENYGPKFAKKSVFICFGVLVLFAVLSVIHSSYKPSSQDTTHTHFTALLSPMPRIIFASILAYLISQLVNISLTTFFKKITHGKYFEIRTLAALILAQACDTCLFGFVGLFGIVSSLLSIMLVSFIIKTIAIFITTPIISLIKKPHDAVSI